MSNTIEKMKKAPITSSKNGSGRAEMSEVAKRLRRISDRALAAGVKVLSRDQIQTLIRETRGGSALKFRG